MPNKNRKSIQPNLSEDLDSNGHVHLPQLLILFGDYCNVWTWKWPILGWLILGWFTCALIPALARATLICGRAAVVLSSCVVEEKCWAAIFLFVPR